MNENDKLKLQDFLNNLYGESYTTKDILNPLTGEILKSKIHDFENSILNAFYIGANFIDMRFINPKHNIIDEVTNFIEIKDKEKSINLSVNTFRYINKEEFEDNKNKATSVKERNRKYVPFRRTGETVYYSNSIFIDLDFYYTEEYKDKTPVEMYNLIKKEQSRFLKALGNYCFTCSGNGLYLFVKLDKTLYFLKDEYKKLWKDISIGINKRLAKYGADPQCAGDFARPFRCPYTYNNKNGDMKQAYILEPFKTDSSKTAKELLRLIKKDIEDIKPVETKIVKGKKEKKKYKYDRETTYNESLVIKNNENDFWHITDPYYVKWFIDERLLDLDILLHLRDNNLVGCRYMFLLIYSAIYNCKAKTTKDTFELVLEINNKFKNPLHESEVIHAVNSIANKNLKFSNFKVKENLKITEEESKVLGLCYTKNELKEQHNIIQKESYTRLHGKMENKKEKIIRIIKENFNADIKDLMRLTGLSRAQVYRYKKLV